MHCQGTNSAAPVRVRWGIQLGLLGLTFTFAFLVVAPALHGMLEGVDGTIGRATPQLVVLLGLMLLSWVALFVRLARPVCEACNGTAPGWLFQALPKQDDGFRPERRGFLRATGTAVAGGAVAATAGVGGLLTPHRRWIPVGGAMFADNKTISDIQHPEWQGARVQNYRRLGRTDAMVSDISMGSGRVRDETGKRVAIEAINRGVNYFDTAPDYSHATSERILGEAIRETGNRHEMFLATKFCTADGHVHANASVKEIMATVDGSLRRLQTDYVDLVHIHSCNDLDRLLSPSTHEAFDRLKEQGKVRFLGFSSHTPELPTIARAAMKSDRFDVMMLAYHWGLWPEISEIMEQAHAMDMGVVAMKTLKGAKAQNLAGFEGDKKSFPQAAFRWVLSNQNVSCLVVSFYEDSQCDEYLYASGQSPRTTDTATLERYDRLVSADYCRPHCGQCLDACPQDRPIDTILRYDMYLADYGDAERAREKYGKLVNSGLDAAGCEACPAPCAGACPYELPIRAKMVRAHERLIEV
ncbi:MAG: aldo/keto reductase [Deltaproteobacteria bacterium]